MAIVGRRSLVVLVSAILAYWILGQLLHFGVFRHVYNHSPGPCSILRGIEHGSEDIQALPNGLAFISSGIRLPNEPREGVVGKIFLFDFNKPQADPVELKIIGPEKYKNLNPHGVSIWTDPKTGTVFLYVINHPPEGDAVDKFKFDATKKTLEHMRRIDNQPDFHVINDLAVVGEDQFYYTNYIYVNDLLEMVFSLHWGSIGFFDGTKTRIIEKGLLVPNGIVASKDHKTLYVAHIGYEEVRVYSRKADNSLTLHQTVFLSTLPDNLDLDQTTGDVWVGAHPSGIKALRHLRHPKQYISPSQVLRIQFPSSDPSVQPIVTEVYSNDGTQLSGSSVAVRHKKGMLVGTVVARTLYCQLNTLHV